MNPLSNSMIENNLGTFLAASEDQEMSNSSSVKRVVDDNRSLLGGESAIPTLKHSDQ